MAEVVVMVLGLVALIAIGTAAVASRKPAAAPPAPPAIEQAREKWVTTGDPQAEAQWRELLEKMED